MNEKKNTRGVNHGQRTTRKQAYNTHLSTECNQKKTPTKHASPAKVDRVQQADPIEIRLHSDYTTPELAARLYLSGYGPIPIAQGEKYPKGFNGWQEIKLPVSPWPNEYGIGIRCGKIIGIDIDVLDSDMVQELLKCFRGLNIITRIGQPPKLLVPVIAPEVTKKLTSKKYKDHDGNINQIEILAHGNQFVAYHIHPDTNRPYEWSGDFVNYAPPCVPLALINSLFDRFYELADTAGWQNISAVESKPRIKKRRDKTGNRAGDLYNRACKIQDVLEEYGWHHWRGDYSTRPGKKHSASGTVFNDN